MLNFPSNNLKNHLAGDSGLRANAFDGTNDYATRAGLSNNANGKKGLISIFFRVDGGDGTSRTLYSTDPALSKFIIYLMDSSNKVTIAGRESSSATVLLDLKSSITIAAGSGWHHLLASWDIGNALAHMYIDDVDVLTTNTLDDGTIGYVRSDLDFGARASDDGNRFYGATSMTYINTGEYMDLSSASNREKFAINGKPRYLGEFGELPTGSQPIMFFKEGDPSVNSGSGGNFSITGALDATRGPA